MGAHPDEQMNVVWHGVDDDEFVLMVLNNSGDVFVEVFFPMLFNQCRAELRGENYLEMDLGICVRHMFMSHRVPNGTRGGYDLCFF